MAILIGLVCHMSLASLAVVASGTGQDVQPTVKPAFKFGGDDYYHRYAKGDLHEFTPKAQPDLRKWTDMVTVNAYSKVKDGEALASTANAVLETYKENQAMVLKTDSLPATAKRPAEHLIIVLFPREEFTEVSYARFLMQRGTGYSVVYSHRINGKEAGGSMSSWLIKHGPARERELMAMKSVPRR